MESLLRMRLDDGRDRADGRAVAFRAAQLIVEGDVGTAVAIGAQIIERVRDRLDPLTEDLNAEAFDYEKMPGARWRAEVGLPELHLIAVPSEKWSSIVPGADGSRAVMEAIQEEMLVVRDSNEAVSLNLVRFAGIAAETEPTPAKVCCGQHPSQVPYDEDPRELLLSRLRASWVRRAHAGVNPPVDLDAIEQKAGSLSLNPWRLNPWRLNPWRLNPWRLNPWRLNPWRLNWGSTMAIPVPPPHIPAVGAVGADGNPTIWILDSGLGDFAGSELVNEAGWGWQDDELSEEIPQRSAEPLDVAVDYRAGFLPHPRISGDFFDRPDQQPDDRQRGGSLGDGYIDVVAGHGTFIAGIYEQLAPGCRMFVRSVLGPDGDASTWTLIAILQKLAARAAKERTVGGEVPADYLNDTIVNLSLSGFEEEPRGRDGSSPPHLEAVIDQLHAAGAVVVGSAGNEGTCEPTFPAAYANVVAVGALDELGPAPYSNFGPWVNLWAPGTDLVSSFLNCDGDMRAVITVDKTSAEVAAARAALFPHLTEELFESMFKDPDDFSTQWAAWSGTSFAAPVVGAAIADEMMNPTGGGGKTAQAALDRVNQAAKLQAGSADERAVVTFGSVLVEIPEDIPVEEP